MRALVTGASGFIGSALARALVRKGHSVVALTRDPAQAEARIGQGVEIVRGSVGLPSEIARAATRCDVLFNAAGIPPGPAPARVLRWLHVAGAENVLRAARHTGVDRVVHISSAEVSLTRDDRMHWDEKRVLPQLPLGAFAQTKLMAEELLLSGSDDDLDVVALRPARVWGPDDTDGVARLVRAARDGRFRLYGGGRNIVATTHIDNLVDAALRAADKGVPGRAYYVTDGEFLEARELFGKLFSALGLPPPALNGNLLWESATEALKARFADDGGGAALELLRRAKSALFDLSAAISDLGYEPSIDLEARIAELKTWVATQGGVEALLARARPAPRAEDVEEQVRAAGGD